MTDIVLCFSTIDTEEEGARIAKALVESRVAACVNIIPKITSVYEWKGELCQEEELLLVIKTQQKRVGELKALLSELHPYEVPELVIFPITDGLPDYLSWVLANTK